MNEEAMRKAFEALCEKRWAGSRGVFAVREDGEYENGNVQFGWACYQAATRAAVPAGLSFDDAVRLARGCADYRGGHYGDAYEAFQHGIQTVVNVLVAAQKNGLAEYQIAFLHAIASEVQP